jgi:hypothetical protein
MLLISAAAGARRRSRSCPICGAAHAACGGTVGPIRATTLEATRMTYQDPADRKLVVVKATTRGGSATELRITQGEARDRGLEIVRPAHRGPSPAPVAAADPPKPKRRRTAKDKARTTPDGDKAAES